MFEERILDKSKGAAPLYYQLEQLIRKSIEDGEFSKGEIFPCEKQLMEIFDVSRVTVRQAMSNLAHDGYIQGERGVGTRVIFQKINESLKSVVSFSDEMKSHGIEMETSLCEVSSMPYDPYIASMLELEKGENIILIKRVRNAKGYPLVYSLTYVPSSFAISLDPVCYSESLYSYLKKEKGIIVASANDTLEAILADNTVSSMLKISEGAAVFKRTRISFDVGKRPIEFSLCYYPGDKYKYNIDL